MSGIGVHFCDRCGALFTTLGRLWDHEDECCGPAPVSSQGSSPCDDTAQPQETAE